MIFLSKAMLVIFFGEFMLTYCCRICHIFKQTASYKMVTAEMSNLLLKGMEINFRQKTFFQLPI